MTTGRSGHNGLQRQSTPEQDTPLFAALREAGCRVIPAAYRERFAPARLYTLEWQDLWVEIPDAERLQVGTNILLPVRGALFRLRFENAIGLTTVRAWAKDAPLDSPVPLVVLSPKFPTLEEHWRFLQALVDDLYQRATRLSFTITAPTGHRVAESRRPPTPLFVLHFLLQYASTLEQALQQVLLMPHRELRENEQIVSLYEAEAADADTLFSVLHRADTWVPAHGFLLARRLRGHAPTEVIQRRPEETVDTAPNRFVLHFIRQLILAIDTLRAQPWWSKVPSERQRIVQEVLAGLQQTIQHPFFAEVGPLQFVPLGSQVLLRRPGYRELRTLWQAFQQARRPVFEPVDQAIALRDIATLYEYWVFFALVEEIGVQLGVTPEIEWRFSEEKGLGWQSRARFAAWGQLVYNKNWQGYSGGLRPDFTWERGGKAEVVLDAKFRADREAAPDEEAALTEAAQRVVRQADIYKMHTYRDSLGVRAAVAVYPGEVNEFFDRWQGHRTDITLKDLLLSDLEGVGAIALRPDC